MDRGTPSAQASHSGNLAVGHRPDQDTCPRSETPGGKVVKLGGAFVKTVRHFWPGLNARLNQLPDTRFAPFIRYDKKFLSWWGSLLFCFKLGSRRQLDYELRDLELQVLDNANPAFRGGRTPSPCTKPSTTSSAMSAPPPSPSCEPGASAPPTAGMKALDACRLPGRFRYFHIPADAFDPLRAARCQIRLDTS